jgi:cation:H+ antiporter
MSTPPFAIFGVSPATVVLFAGYALGMRLSAKAREEPMWRPSSTSETQRDEPAPKMAWKGGRSWFEFAALALLAASTGFVLAETGVELAAKSGLSQTAVGAVFTAVTTSLPELVTSIARVR